MRRVIYLALFVSFPAASQAVNLYADTALTAPGSCGIYLDAAAKVVVPTVLVGTVHTCKYDVTGVSNGAHTAKITAIATSDPVWGSQESAQSAPFPFVKPAIPSAPTSLRLGP